MEKPTQEKTNRRVITLDRKVFDAVYPKKVVSTLFGHPFIDPAIAAETYRHLAQTMQDAGIELGVLYSRLSEQGQTLSGPSAAAKDILGDVKFNHRAQKRYERYKGEIQTELKAKYGDWIAPHGGIAMGAIGHNFSSHARREAAQAKIVRLDNPSVEVPLRIKGHFGDPDALDNVGHLSLLSRERKGQISANIMAADVDRANLSGLAFTPEKYTRIMRADSIEELTFQVLLVDDSDRVSLDISEGSLASMPKRTNEAYHIACMLTASDARFANLLTELPQKYRRAS